MYVISGANALFIIKHWKSGFPRSEFVAKLLCDMLTAPPPPSIGKYPILPAYFANLLLITSGSGLIKGCKCDRHWRDLICWPRSDTLGKLFGFRQVFSGMLCRVFWWEEAALEPAVPTAPRQVAFPQEPCVTWLPRWSKVCSLQVARLPVWESVCQGIIDSELLWFRFREEIEGAAWRMQIMWSAVGYSTAEWIRYKFITNLQVRRRILFHNHWNREF